MGSLYNVSGKLAGDNKNNLAGNLLHGAGGIMPQLRDPTNLDFRPKPGSQLDAAGAGAYASSGDFWIPGRQLHAPSRPTPTHGAVNVNPAAVELMWLGAYKGKAHTLKIGKQGDQLATIQSFGLGSELVSLQVLESGATYYWQVSAQTESGREVLSPLWSFTT